MKRNPLGLMSLASAVCVIAAGAAPVANATGADATTSPQTPATAAPAAATGRTIAPLTSDAQAKQLATARSEADKTAKDIGLGAHEALVVKNVITDTDGTRHIRYDRTYKGMPVIGGDLVVVRNAAGAIVETIFDAKGAINVPTTVKAIDKGKAHKAAIARAVKGTHGKTVKAPKVTKDQLAVYLDRDGSARLVLAVTTAGVGEDQTPSHRTSYVDAAGTVVLSDEKIKNGTGYGDYNGTVPLPTTRQTSGYLLKNPTTGNQTTDVNNQTWADNVVGPFGTPFVDADDTWGNGSNSNRQTAAVDAQFGADATVAYLKNVLGRNGIWDTGKGAVSRVHYGRGYINAYWNGTYMTYGDGYQDMNPLTQLDIAAHEMGHGVTENTAGLIYSGDAGGLNESTSDILGAAVEFNANLTADRPDYQMGELINFGSGAGDPLRYMDKPSKDGRSFDCWSSTMGNNDPHYTSGPLNHWYYMASEGSGAKTINGIAYNSPTCGGAPAVTGAGRVNIEKVWYRTLSTKLTSRSSYRDAREGAIKSAIEMYGATSPICTAVEKGFNAISVPAGLAKCSGGTTDPVGTERIVNGGFESGTTGWTGSTGPITNNAGQAARTGTWKMWLGGNGTTTTEYEQQTVSIPATAPSATLSYWIHIDSAETTTSTAYDRSTVTLTPSGSTTATTLASYSNLNKATGYRQVTIDLSAYKGRTVTLKFNGTEDSSQQTSFVFDDISLKA